MAVFRSSFIAFEWTILLVAAAIAATTTSAEVRCGEYVDYTLQSSSYYHCLQHNSSAPATAVILWNTKVVRVLELLSEQPVELTADPGSILSLRSPLLLCYTLSEGKCRETFRGPERDTRSAPGTDLSMEDQSQSRSHKMLFGWSVLALLVMLPLATISLLCCHAEGKNSQSMKSRKLSTKNRKSIAASTDISINITDSDNPLGSDFSTTFHKSVEAKCDSTVFSSSRAASPLSLHHDSASSAQPLLESSLDVGTRDGVKHGSSLSSIISLGPRVPPEGSSLDNLSAIRTPSPSPTHPLKMPPPPTVPPPPSHHLRQHSTPISLPPPLSPQQKLRPLTVIGQPSEEQRYSGAPLVPPKPATDSSPQLSPVSLSDREALAPVKLGRVRPYRVVHQPSPYLSSLPHLPHSSEGPNCRQCGARLAADQDPLSLVDTGSEVTSDTGECCQQCQMNDPHYHELDASDEDILFSPPPPVNGSPEPDPLYERIGSIRRHHMISLRSKSRIKPRLPSPVHITNIDSSSRATCPLPPGDINRFPKCPLPPKGAPLPPRPPTLGLMRGDSIPDHNYESLPSTFSVDSPEDTVYAHISTPEAGEAQSPPFIPDGGQRAHMLKIDSQGYAEVVNKEEEEDWEGEPSSPDPGYSPILPLSPASQAVASDYEVPVRIAPPPPSPSLLHPQLSPIPVPSPMAPFSNLDKTPPSLPLPTHSPSTTADPSLRRQRVIAENPLPLTARSLSVLPQQERESHDSSYRDSSGSEVSYHLSFRVSTASSGLGEAVTESLRAIAEEEGAHDQRGQSSSAEPAVIKRKIYEVENRSRTKSYPEPEVRPPAGRDVAAHKLKAQSMNRVHISFNQDSQTV